MSFVSGGLVLCWKSAVFDAAPSGTGPVLTTGTYKHRSWLPVLPFVFRMDSMPLLGPHRSVPALQHDSMAQLAAAPPALRTV